MAISVKELLEIQKKFSDACFDQNDMSDKDIVEKHKTFCLSLHDEVAQLSNAVHYKDHRQEISPVDRQRVLYETIDIMRYSLATLNLWGITHKEFLDGFYARDASLWDKKNRALSSWSGQKVAIVDVDDVIARFREGFFAWLNDRFDLDLSVDLPEYYYSGPVGSMTGEEAFSLFIDEGGFRDLKANNNVIETLQDLKKEGYWIQLLTARPDDNLKCMYDTYHWLEKEKIPYDNLAFSSEKYRWLSDKPFFKNNKISFAIDDSPKHASEYATHGIKVAVPMRSYNKEVWKNQNIYPFEWETESFLNVVQ